MSALILDLHSQLRKEQKNAHSAKKKATRHKRKANELKQQLLAKESELFSSINFHKNSKRRKRGAVKCTLSLYGGYKLALLRSVGHASCVTLLTTLDARTSRQNLPKWEKLLAANLSAQAKGWYADHAQERLRAEHTGDLKDKTWEIHNIRGDATNTNASQSLKAHCAKVKSRYSPVRQGDEHADCPDHFQQSFVPDVQHIPEVCGAKVTHQLYVKHLASIGCPSPGFVDETRDFMRDIPDLPHVMVWLFFTDCGSDEVGAGKLFVDDVELDPLRCP